MKREKEQSNKKISKFRQEIMEDVSEEAKKIIREEEAVGNLGLNKVVFWLGILDLFLAAFAYLGYWMWCHPEILSGSPDKMEGRGYELLFVVAIAALVGSVLKLFFWFYCKKAKGAKPFFKYVFIILMLADITTLQAIGGMGWEYFFLIPIIFSCFYFDYFFTRKVIWIDILFYVVSGFVSLSYSSIEPEYVTVTQDFYLPAGSSINGLFATEAGVDMWRYKYSMITGNIIPGALILLLIGIICCEVSKRGQRMTVRQNRMVKKATSIETELNLAAKIQLDMVPNKFPAFPDHNQFDLYAMMEPAKNVGGDFYDYYMLDDDHLAIVMADVCGKGVPAALFMSRSRTCLQDHLSSVELPLTEAVNRTNKMMREHNPSMTFVTAWIGVINIHTGDVDFVNAGHTMPILLDKDGNEKTFEYDSNIMIGATKYKFVKDSIKLEKGDRLFLCTDGIYEAHIMNGEEDMGVTDEMLFGRERAVKVLQANMGKTTEESVKALKSAVDEYVNHTIPFDDITMLYLTFNGEVE